MIEAGVASHTIGGIAFVALTVLLAIGWGGRLQGGAVVAAAALSAAWCFWLAYRARWGAPFTAETFLFELLRVGAWLAFLVALLGGYDNSRRPVSRAVVFAIHALWGLMVLYATAVVLGVHADLSLATAALVVLAVVGLILLEYIYRNTRREHRWAIKFLVLAVGAIFAYDLVLYSLALLFRQIDVTLWNARGVVNALAVPLIAIAATRNPGWSVTPFVSRQMVFYSSAVIGAGVYLLAIAAGGYYVRRYGGSWGAFAEVVLLTAAVLALAVVMLSGDLRARARVFVVKHFYRNKYDYRVEWLRLIRTLASADDASPLPERAVRALAQLVESPGGTLWLQQDDRGLTPVARWGAAQPGEAVEPADGALVRFLEAREWVIDVPEWRRDPARYANLPLPAWLRSQSRAWLVVPLILGVRALGFVVLVSAPRPGRLTWEDTDLLKTAGRQVASHLAQDRAAQALAQARQFDAFHRMTAFIMHDLKNLIAQQSLVVQNAARHQGNPAFVEDVIRTVENSVKRMNQLLDQLQRGDAPARPRRSPLRDLLIEVVARHQGSRPAPELQLSPEEVDAMVDPQGFSAILGHVVRNAQEATPPDGRVRISLRREDARAVIDIEDSGAGMDPAFVAERLFRPFDSTKGSKGMGIGAYQVREFVRAAGGEVGVRSAPGQGTTFRIVLPALGPRHDGEPAPAIEREQ